MKIDWIIEMTNELFLKGVNAFFLQGVKNIVPNKWSCSCLR